MKANYEHDCDSCILLGTDVHDGDPVDVYVCPQNGDPTIVIRYDHNGPDYTSWNMSYLMGATVSAIRKSSSVPFSLELALKFYDQALKALSKIDSK